MTVETAESPSTHVNMRRIHPGYKKEEDVLLSSNDCGFICAGVNSFGGCK